jgi:hypothetical protein
MIPPGSCPNFAGDPQRVVAGAKRPVNRIVTTLSVLQILFQVSIVVFMRPYHNKFQITANLSIGKQVLGSFEFELVYEYIFQVTFLFLPNGWVFRNSFYFSIERVLFGTRHLLYFFLK